MKRFLALLLVALLVIPCVALASQIDLTALSDEELQALQKDVEAEIASRKPAQKAVTGEVDGFSVSIDSVEVNAIDSLLIVNYTFSHTKQEAQNFMALRTQVYQNGIECDTDISSDQYNDLFRDVQAGVKYSVSKTYILYDLSADVDCVVLSWDGTNKKERVESSYSIVQ